MIDLTLNGFLHPDILGLSPQFGTIITRDAENKGGLSTAQTDTNMGLPFSLMRPVPVSSSDTTSKIEFDAKILITGSSEVTITLERAVYEGCRLTVTNRATAVAIITAEKIEGVTGGRINLGINCILELNYTESDGWVYSNAIVGEIRILTETEAPAGWLICDGTEYNILQYPRLAPIMLKLPFNAGVTDGRFRVPDLRGRFLQGGGENLGEMIDAGLPNIIGTTGKSIQHQGSGFSGVKDYGGAFYKYEQNNDGNQEGGSSAGRYYFDASYGETRTDGTLKTDEDYKVYGKSDTVQPPAFTVNYTIKY